MREGGNFGLLQQRRKEQKNKKKERGRKRGYGCVTPTQYNDSSLSSLNIQGHSRKQLVETNLSHQLDQGLNFTYRLMQNVQMQEIQI